jgi:hypothetical protein
VYEILKERDIYVARLKEIKEKLYPTNAIKRGAEIISNLL